MKKSNFGHIDDKALDILVKYKLTSFEHIPEEERLYAFEKGYLFEDLKIEHDDALLELFNAYNAIDKKKVTKYFLASLSNNQVSYRAGLSIYSILQTYPKHSFITRESLNEKRQTMPCIVCSSYKYNTHSINFMNLLRITTGGFLIHSVYNYFLFAKEVCKIGMDIEPSSQDFLIFNHLINMIKENSNLKSPSELLNLIKKEAILKMCDDIQIHRIIETLGYCSILASKEKKGPLYEFVNLASSPKKSRSSEWAFPVDFWTGQDGIDIEAFKFWFGEYKELEKCWK